MLQIRQIFAAISVEPLMLLDGLAFSSIHVYIENLQMDRVCRVSAGFPEEICGDLKGNQNASVEVQQKYSVFAFYNGIISAALPLFFILFMGAWSDKYGRKVPLVAVQLGHALHAAGYVLTSLFPSWPAEIMLVVTLLDTLGGGTVSFLTAANSYLGDVTSEESRTSRVGLANSIWFLGGPAGTLLGNYIYSKGGYLPLFVTALTLSILSVFYVLLYLPESHGPFARNTHQESLSGKTELKMRDSVAAVYGMEVKKNPSVCKQDISLLTMVRDFFSFRRIQDSLKATLKKREGNTRVLLVLLIFTSLLRRLTRSPYVFAFTRHVLGWDASTYSFWVTYKNLMATAGSMVAVPLLSGRLRVSDNILALVGALSGVVEYITYGCVTEEYSRLIYIAPLSALLLNSCTIAQRSMMTKFVASDEIGKVSAVLGALDGMMPMVSYSLYTAVYHASVSIFPAAHFFLGTAASSLMMVIFCAIIYNSQSQEYDVEGAKPKESTGPVVHKSLVKKESDSHWLNSDYIALAAVPYQEVFILFACKTFQSNAKEQFQDGCFLQGHVKRDDLVQCQEICQIKDQITDQNSQITNQIKENSQITDQIKENHQITDQIKENRQIMDQIKENSQTMDQMKEESQNNDKLNENFQNEDEIEENNSENSDQMDVNNSENSDQMDVNNSDNKDQIKENGQNEDQSE